MIFRFKGDESIYEVVDGEEEAQAQYRTLEGQEDYDSLIESEWDLDYGDPVEDTGVVPAEFVTDSPVIEELI